MITSTQIMQLSHLLENEEVIKINYGSGNQTIIHADEQIDESTDNTAIFIKRDNGRCVIVNLDKVECVFTSKLYL